MNRQLLGWWVGFGATATMAVTLVLSTSVRKSPAQAPAPARGDATKVSHADVELILHKIREGDLHAHRNDLEAARQAWTEARRLGGGLWAIHEGLGDSLVRSKFYDEAVREYRTAEPLVPERPAALRHGIVFKRAEALAASEKPLEALEAYLALNQPGPHAQKILDQALKVADRAAAEKALTQRAAVFDPRVYGLLSAFYTKTDRKLEAAESTAHYVMAVAPWEGDLNREAIKGLRAARKFDLAIEVCRAWLRSTPQAIHVYQLLGDLLREAGREREAVVAYTSIVDVRPGDAQAHRLLGDIFKGLNRPRDAIAQYECVKKARPEDAETWRTLVALYEATGDAARVEQTLLEATNCPVLANEFRPRLAVLYMDRMAKLKAAGKGEEARALRRKLANLNVVEAGLFDIKIIMTWDALSDVDLDVYEPGGEHVVHSYPQSKAGGRYHGDNTRGYGPEVYTISKAAPGTYRVGAHLHGNTRSTVKFVIVLHEDTAREEHREETIILDSRGDPKFIRDIVIER